MPPKIEAGPGWIIIQALDPSADYNPVGDIGNLLYNKEVKCAWQPKEYLVEPDNAPRHVARLALGLESCEVTANLLSISTDILAAVSGEPRSDPATPYAETDVIDITGFGEMPAFRVCVILPNLIDNNRMFSTIENGGDLICTIFEMRVAGVGGEAVEYTASKDSERLLAFKAAGESRPGVTAIPAKLKRNVVLSVTDRAGGLHLNNPTLGAWPGTLYS